MSEMAEALGLKSFSLITRTSFGCYSCHLDPTPPNLAADRLFIPQISDAMPESLPFADFREVVLEMNTGLMRTPDTVGWECIAVLGNGQVVLKDPPGGLVSLHDDGANIYLLPSGSGSLVVLTS